MSYSVARNQAANGELNKLYPEDRAIHEWYRFVLSFPPHLVQEYVRRFRLSTDARVLDPFCGTGTTLVECKKLGLASAGVEAHPMAHFAAEVKTDWTPDPEGLLNHARAIGTSATRQLEAEGVPDEPALSLTTEIERPELRTLGAEQLGLLLSDCISPLPLHKTLVLLDCINAQRDDLYYRHELLALAKALVCSVSNLHFGPEVGVGAVKSDASVVSVWLNGVAGMASDLWRLTGKCTAPSTVLHADSRLIGELVEPESVDAVITSPPYPNEKDYTRTTRLESVVLGFIRDRAELRMLKRGLLRSNTRGVYKGDDDDHWVASHPEIQAIAEAIEGRRVELGKTSGFERMYARVTKLYFGGMARHLAGVRPVLKPGARLAYVVGDQASYLRVMIRTGQILADIARSLGYEVEGIELFRTRLATATRAQLREEVVLLRWPGGAR